MISGKGHAEMRVAMSDVKNMCTFHPRKSRVFHFIGSHFAKKISRICSDCLLMQALGLGPSTKAKMGKGNNEQTLK